MALTQPPLPHPTYVETRPHDGYTVLWSEVGRTRVSVRCPFCRQKVHAFLWSLAGSGKRCDCGAVCGRFSARKVRKAPRKEQEWL